MVLSQIPVTAAVLAVLTGIFAVLNAATRGSAGVTAAIIEGLCAIALGVIAVVASRPWFPLKLAHAFSWLLLTLLASVAVLVAQSVHDTNGGAYVALFALISAFLLLSWPWFFAALATAGAMAAAFAMMGSWAPSQFEDVALVASGLVVGMLVQYSRRKNWELGARNVRDIMEARAAAAAAEARMRAVFQRSPTGLILADPKQARILQVNPAACAILGYRADELVGRPSSALVAPGMSREAHAEVVRKLSSGEAAFLEGDREFQRKDGSSVIVHVKGVLGRDEDGEAAWLMALMEDVSEARRQEELLRRQAHMLASIGQAVMVTDLTGRITFWNSAAERIYGWSSAEALGRNILETTPTVSSAPDAAKIFELLTRGESWSGEIELRRKDGTTLWAWVTDAPLTDASGKLVGIIGISEDITARKRTEAALRRAERDAALGTLVAGVAHEINNPLQFMGGHLDLVSMDLEALRGSSSIVEEDRRLLDDIRGELDVVRRGVDQITHITRSLRQVARRSGAPRRKEELRSLVEAVVASARPRLGPNVDVHIAAEGHPAAVVSGEEVMQVILNLVLNASEAMDGTGQLTIRSLERGDTVVLEVEDTGPGIPPDVQARLFTPFFTTKAHGTGLGLSISHAIVRDHGGELTFETRPGRTVFRVTLPATGRGSDGGKPHAHMHRA